MEFSARLNKLGKKIDHDQNKGAGMILMADLLAIGYTEAEVWSIVHQYDTNQALASTKVRDATLHGAVFKNLLKERAKALKSKRVISTTAEDIDLITPEQIAKELLRSAWAQPEGSIERGNFLMKYEDVMRKNQSVSAETDDDGGVGVYLPVKCYQCPLLKQYNDNLKEKLNGTDTTEHDSETVGD